MKTWQHPELGTVGPIVRARQHKKVWKHLYNPVERWGELGAGEPAQLEAEAVQAGCPPFFPGVAPPHMDWRVVRVLQKQHDRAFEPAYTRELRAPGTQWRVKVACPERWVARTPRAVVSFVRIGAPARVVTAYRPHPPVPDVNWGEADFQTQADYLFDKETAMRSAWVERVVIELDARGSRVPTTPQDAWWLALAVGYGRPLRADARIARALEKAEQQLLDAAALSLVPSVDVDRLLDRLGEALKGEELEDLEAGLAAVEDALVVADAAKLAYGTPLLAKATELISWLGAHETIAAHAAQRAELLRDSSAAEFWDAVDEAVVAAALREGAPERQPGAALVDELLPSTSSTERFATLLDSWAKQSAGWVEQVVAGVRLAPAVPAMGASTQPWELRASLPEGTQHIRAFVVDPEYPNGYEVSEMFVQGGAVLWHLERPGQEAMLVVIGAGSPVRGASLAEVIEAAADRSDAMVVSEVFSRPK